MRCAACQASIHGVFPGGVARCPSCGASNRAPDAARHATPSPLSDPSSPYRAADARVASEPVVMPCPFCGAEIAGAARVCPHCDVKLDAVRCVHCFALHVVGAGARACGHCGRDLELEPLLDPTDAPCPSCDRTLEAVPDPRALVGSDGVAAGMHECAGCGGLFVDHATLARITEDREKAGPLLSTKPFEIPRASSVDTAIRYVKCPLCHQTMNRANFGRKSGVIVDVCKLHGTWFDAGELTRAIEFVASGGLAGTRLRDREDAVALASTRDKRERPSIAEARMMSELMLDNLREERSVAIATDVAENIIRALFDYY